MKRIICFISILFITWHQLAAQQPDCDNCLPSKVYLSDGILKGRDLGDDDKNLAFAALLQAAYNYMMKEDPAAGCMVITNKRPVEKSPYSVVADITGADGNMTMELTLLARCDGRKIAKSSVPVDLMGDEESIKAAGEKAARQLMPLSQKIMVHALNLRENNTAFMLNGESANMEIRLKDPNVPVGQETEMYVTMTDCDGYPLKNRTICFKPESFKGRQIAGVIGGVVTPACAKTDAAGKLKVRFKRTAKSAMICGHYKGFDPAGCEDAVIGVLHVGDMPVKVVLKYKYYHNGGATAREGGINDYSATEEQTCDITCYYFPVNPLQETFSFSIPLKGAQAGGKIVYLKEEGMYETHAAATGDAAPLVFGDLDVGNRSRRRSGSIDRNKRTSVKIKWAGRDIANIDSLNKGDLFYSLPVTTQFKNGVYAGSKVEIVFGYVPGTQAEAEATEDDDLFVPLPGDEPAAVKRQMLNTPVKDIYFDEATRDAFFKEIKFTKEENPSYKKLIRFGMFTDRQAPAHKIMGDNVNLVLADALYEICLVEVYVPR